MIKAIHFRKKLEQEQTETVQSFVEKKLAKILKAGNFTNNLHFVIDNWDHFYCKDIVKELIDRGFTDVQYEYHDDDWVGPKYIEFSFKIN